jgi:hypothetical protein
VFGPSPVPEVEYPPFSPPASPLGSVPVSGSAGRQQSGDIGNDSRRTHRLLIGSALAVVLVLSVVALLTSGSKLFSESTTVPAPRTTAAGLLAGGAKAELAGHTALAESSYAAALKLQPRNATVVYDLGTLAQQWGKAGAALSYYDQALVDDPDMTPAMYNKAILVAATDPVAATLIYQRIVSIEPTASTSYFNLGLLLDTNPATRSQGLSDLAEAVHLRPALKPLVPAGLTLPTVTPIGGSSPPASPAAKR